ncbi:DUF2730 domain-containing protein [bacterium]|nr:DUF2730 domain-containing protein [bacterium]
MENTILDFLKDYWAIITSLILGALWLVELGKSRLSKRVENIEKDVKKIDKIEIQVEDIKKDIEVIKNNLKIIEHAIIKCDAIQINSEALRACSPLNLTEKGLEIIKNSKFEEVFKENRKDFFDFIDNQKAENSLDIESAAIRSILFLMNKEYFNSVKEYFYNFPNESMWIVLGIYVRDYYMKERGK